MGGQQTNRLDDPDAFAKMSADEIADWTRKALELPDNFGSSDDRFRHCADRVWSLGPVIRHRDSGLLEQSNADALIAMLESDPTLADQWDVIGCSHWAVGWVDHIAFVVLGPDGEPSRVARVIKGFYDALSDYPVADEEDYRRREYEATIENIGGHHCAGMLRDDVPDTWATDMWQWFWDRNQGAIENTDDQGGYPSDDEFETAARALGFWDTGDDETDTD